MAIPRIVIAGTHSGAGKTTIATALMAALSRRGLTVQPFKVGPDFIDPGFHAAACGRASRNLDGWMLTRDTNLALFERASANADIAVIEGVMGLFDGRDACSEAGSTAEMAKWLDAPVMLIVDASAMARSAAAIVHGFEDFDAGLNLKSVIFNRVGGPGHTKILRDAVRQSCRAEVLGGLPPNPRIELPSRHLGLALAEESLMDSMLTEMANWIEGNLDLERIAAGTAVAVRSSAPQTVREPRVRIAVARDAAFCFYYQDNLDALIHAGAELVWFSPITDASLPPDIGGVYLGGGYPELHAEALSRNAAMRCAIRQAAESGLPVYAECGGFMYLTEAIVDAEGREHPMAGVFPTKARMQPRLAAIGYSHPEPSNDALWASGCTSLRGHEFRYSTIDPMPAEIARAYQEPASGFRFHNVLAGYTHLHFLSDKRFPRRFVEACGNRR
jgi:cobyrinic acid a,c-diamide synthase